MAGGATQVKIVLGVFLAAAFVTWIISIIGLAGLQRNCWNLQSLGAGTGSGADAITGLPHTGIRGFSRSLDCSKIYRYYWWQLAFELISLIGLAVLMAAGLLAASALSWLAWFTVLTLLWMQGSDSFLGLQKLAYGSVIDDGTWVFSRLTSAGWIMTTILNLGIIFALGWRPRRVLNAAAGGPIKY